ncbi:Alpha-1:3-mannosyl-glycoprotein 4-beta-N-acetylglucosaminyltransferase B-like protein [Leptotrombidium deliense]|uniref:Alpha-1:3-mannosyl-glycoprotein 4-beta-N-acetylglucosaminyltransferase B-like protein n=1 Tax=Leptotrombidium deliense TaxID=299467 RepID=A0A443RUD7_9ACAR|nr:Alpha-1:3-mannosyl-glycoprotein 4-beta-N-acetylglucosaminyltransferase B-like protein [Leptotrombidium deliense]
MFREYIKSGLLELISPPVSYYPEYSNKTTLGDPLYRVRWRTKQNLDYAYLMNYCKDRGEFYIQLEDDILTRRNYIQLIENNLKHVSRVYKNWFLIHLSRLGFIGKLMKTSDLPMLISAFYNFREYQPVDWLLDYILRIRFCAIDSSKLSCARNILKYTIFVKQPLFQHIGYHSSLKGKIQKLMDKNFPKETKSKKRSRWWIFRRSLF